MNENNYSKSALNLLRFFSIIGILAELLCILRLFLHSGITLDFFQIYNFVSFCYSDFYSFIIDSIGLIFFIVLVFIPRKYELFALISFVYSIKIITVDTIPEKPIGFILYLAGTSCLLHKNFYKNHTLIKIIITIATYFTLLLHSLRFGIQVYIDSLIITFGYGLAVLSTIFFVVNFLKIMHVKKTARVWDLSQYSGLTSRDKEWLKQILEEKRYEEIAKDSDVTVGTLKNRMHQIFSIVGITDRISLLATYGGYEVKF